VRLPASVSVLDSVPTDPASGLPVEVVRKRDEARMVLIPAGGFLMGTPEQDVSQLVATFGRSHEAYNCEVPQRTVVLDVFYIDKHEVTNRMYSQFCEATGHRKPKYWGNETYPPGKEHHPVRAVNWHDATAYASWADACLPTEAQWEKAARGTDGRLFPWGNELDYRRAHYLRLEYFEHWESFDVSPSEFNAYPTAVVGSHSQGDSPYGVADMLGNVWEWCLDRFDCTYYTWGPMENPVGPRIGEERILRGCASVYDLHKFRCAYRHMASPDTSSTELFGFRCAYNL
jgi:formylglycine-generating enzyme required for sulfatase activity